MTTLRIPQRLVDDLDSHALSAYPEECCGALLGPRESGESAGVRRVSSLWPAQNVHAGPRSSRYAIAPEELLEAYVLARKLGHEVLGYYHSHPDGGAAPSATDLDEAASGVSYLIVAVTVQGVLERRSWRLRTDNARFEEEQLI